MHLPCLSSEAHEAPFEFCTTQPAEWFRERALTLFPHQTAFLHASRPVWVGVCFSPRLHSNASNGSNTKRIKFQQPLSYSIELHQPRNCSSITLCLVKWLNVWGRNHDVIGMSTGPYPPVCVSLCAALSRPVVDWEGFKRRGIIIIRRENLCVRNHPVLRTTKRKIGTDFRCFFQYSRRKCCSEQRHSPKEWTTIPSPRCVLCELDSRELFLFFQVCGLLQWNFDSATRWGQVCRRKSSRQNFMTTERGLSEHVKQMPSITRCHTSQYWHENSTAVICIQHRVFTHHGSRETRLQRYNPPRNPPLFACFAKLLSQVSF